MKTILIIGGYGNTGRLIARLLLGQRRNIHVLIAGRNLEKAQALADDLNTAIGAVRASAIRLDVADPKSLDEALPQCDLVVNAASTLAHTRTYAEAILRHQKDGLDIHLSSPEKWTVLNALRDRFRQSGIVYITDGGFHPGVPAALIRYAARQMDVLEKGNVYSAMRIDWGSLEFSRETMDEFVEEFRHYESGILRGGQWKNPSMWKTFSFEFDPPFGKQYCVPMYMRELGELARQLPGLQETGFYVTGFNPLVDYVLSPVVFAGVKTLPPRLHSPLVNMFVWGLKRTKPPYGVQLVADCEGKCDGAPMAFRLTLFHEDGYVLTAVPAVACLLQYLDGRLNQPGLHLQGNAVEPERFLKDMERMGIQVTEKEQVLEAVAG